MEDLRKHLRDIEADFDPVHLAHTVHTLVALTYELASEGIPLNDIDGWRNRKLPRQAHISKVEFSAFLVT
jgi:hypothetical protein